MVNIISITICMNKLLCLEVDHRVNALLIVKCQVHTKTYDGLYCDLQI